MTSIRRQILCVLSVALSGGVALLAFSNDGAWGQPSGDALDEDPAGAPYVAGELIVNYEERAPEQAVESLDEEADAQVEDEFPEIDAKLLEFPEVKDEGSNEARKQDLGRIKENLETDPSVESVDYNYLVEAADTPNDPRFGEQWGLEEIRSPKAWDTSEGRGVVVAVLDTGIDPDHPEFEEKVVAQQNFVSWDESNVPGDGDGHGTHVAGIVAAATNNDVGVAGVCPGCELLVGEVLNDEGDGSLADVLDGIFWAVDVNEAKVINLSLSSPQGASALQNAVEYAWNEGSVIVAAAGNKGRNVKEYPAAYSNAIAVGATNRNGNRASFSNHGAWLDVSAPGAAILSTDLSGGYAFMSGTSMAAPHVSGLAGLLAANPQLDTPAKIRGIVESTATDAGPVGKDEYHGWGLINAAAGVSCTIFGTIGNDDDLDGTSGDDAICALTGKDTIRALGGNDKVFAGPGHDVVRGGDGNDTAIGGAGKDRLLGNAGRDRLRGKDGAKGNDSLRGGAGKDRCAADKKDTVRSC